MEMTEEQKRLMQTAQLVQAMQSAQEPQQEPQTFLPHDPDYGLDEIPLVGVVGHGFVGKAVEKSFVHTVNRFLVDPNYGTDIDQLIERQPSLVFVCTPTPVGENGAIDAAVTTDAILKLLASTKAGVVLKSTVTPDVLSKIVMTIESQQNAHRFIYAPEFLTEKNAAAEFANPEYMVFGGVPSSCSELIEFFRYSTVLRMPQGPDRVHIVHPVEASFIKYAINCYLAMKVTFFNQLNDALEQEPTCLPANVLKAISCEPRIGRSHWQAPGPDGKKGFGGACFPKDISAMINYTDKLTLLEKVIEINNEYRAEYDLDDREKEQNITFLTEGETK